MGKAQRFSKRAQAWWDSLARESPLLPLANAVINHREALDIRSIWSYSQRCLENNHGYG